MFKRLLIGLMCVGLILLVKEANAGIRFSSTGWGWTNSISCYSLAKGLGNTYNYDVIIECVILPIEINAQCMNPGGQVGDSIIRFDLTESPEIDASEVVDPNQIYAKGKVETDVIIHELTIYEGLSVADLNAMNAVCDDFNSGSSDWTVAPPPEGFINVIKMFAALRAGEDLDGDGFIDVLADDVQVACKAPDNADFDGDGDYLCDELCDNTKNFDCPGSLTAYTAGTCVDGSAAPDCYFDF